MKTSKPKTESKKENSLEYKKYKVINEFMLGETIIHVNQAIMLNNEQAEQFVGCVQLYV